jgi:hypothetical protein
MAEKNKALPYNGFEFNSPLFAYLEDYGTEEVMRCGKRLVSKVDLDLDPREIEASGYGKIEEAADIEDCDY